MEEPANCGLFTMQAELFTDIVVIVYQTSPQLSSQSLPPNLSRLGSSCLGMTTHCQDLVVS